MSSKFKLIAIISVILITNSFILNAQTKYDVEFQFVKMKCLKVVEAPLDTEEDIYGSITLGGGRMKNTSGIFTPIVAFSFLSIGKSNQIKLGLNQSRTFSKIHTLPNLTYDQLISIEYLLGGTIYDDEVFAVKYKNCNECGIDFRKIMMSTYKSQIDAMAANSFKFLTIGDDNILELNFFEGDNNSSHIQFQFKIKVIKK